MSKSIKALAILGVVAGLGVAALPLSSYAEGGDPARIVHTNLTDTDNTYTNDAGFEMGVQLELKDYISIESDDEFDAAKDNYIVIKDVLNNGDIAESEPASFVVNTNNAAGYFVSLKAGTNSIVDGKGVLKNAAGNTIVSGTPTQGASAWGYKVAPATGVSNVASAATGWTTVTDTDTKIATGAAATGENGDTIEITFGATAKPNQEPGTYTGTVIITATSGTAGVAPSAGE